MIGKLSPIPVLQAWNDDEDEENGSGRAWLRHRLFPYVHQSNYLSRIFANTLVVVDPRNVIEDPTTALRVTVARRKGLFFTSIIATIGEWCSTRTIVFLFCSWWTTTEASRWKRPRRFLPSYCEWSSSSYKCSLATMIIFPPEMHVEPHKTSFFTHRASYWAHSYCIFLGCKTNSFPSHGHFCKGQRMNSSSVITRRRTMWLRAIGGYLVTLRFTSYSTSSQVGNSSLYNLVIHFTLKRMG